MTGSFPVADHLRCLASASSDILTDSSFLVTACWDRTLLWVRYDRRLSGRSRNIDVMDYRAGMKQQELNGKGEASPTDRSDKNNGWIDWAVSARSDDPAQLASALEEVGLSLEEWVGV